MHVIKNAYLCSTKYFLRMMLYKSYKSLLLLISLLWSGVENLLYVSIYAGFSGIMGAFWKNQKSLWMFQKSLWFAQKSLWMWEKSLWFTKKSLWMWKKSLWFAQKSLWIREKSLWMCQKSLWFLDRFAPKWNFSIFHPALSQPIFSYSV